MNSLYRKNADNIILSRTVPHVVIRENKVQETIDSLLADYLLDRKDASSIILDRVEHWFTPVSEHDIAIIVGVAIIRKD